MGRDKIHGDDYLPQYMLTEELKTIVLYQFF